MQQFIRESRDGVLLSIQVVPRSSRNEIVGVRAGELRIRLNAAPVEGAANKALIALICRTLDSPRQTVQIVSGHYSRHKTVSLSGLTREAVEQKLASLLQD